jgi:hypothetical protein
MNVKVVFSTIGRMLLVEAVLLCLPLTVALTLIASNVVLNATPASAPTLINEEVI